MGDVIEKGVFMKRTIPVFFAVVLIVILTFA